MPAKKKRHARSKRTPPPLPRIFRHFPRNVVGRSLATCGRPINGGAHAHKPVSVFIWTHQIRKAVTCPRPKLHSFTPWRRRPCSASTGCPCTRGPPELRFGRRGDGTNPSRLLGGRVSLVSSSKMGRKVLWLKQALANTRGFPYCAVARKEDAKGKPTPCFSTTHSGSLLLNHKGGSKAKIARLQSNKSRPWDEPCVSRPCWKCPRYGSGWSGPLSHSPASAGLPGVEKKQGLTVP